ncbi:hypothetical protein D3C85_1946420 [compost metagenome]
MCPDIDQRASALLFFIQEYSPRRNRTAAQRNRLTVINITEFSTLAESFQIFTVGTVAVLVCD